MVRSRFHHVVTADSSQFGQAMNRLPIVAARAGSAVAGRFRMMGKSLDAVTTRLGGAALSLAKFGAATAAIAVPAAFSVGIAKAAKAASAFEDISLRIQTFTGSAETMQKVLGEVTKFATATPFETRDLQETTAKLLGMGMAAEEVVDIVKELGAVSKDGQQLGELADALGKGFTKNKFQTEELNKFLERGINLMPELEKVTGKTGKELTKAIEAGLGFDQVRQAIANLSAEGGQFFGLLEKQSRTAGGLVSTLKSNVEELFTQFGQPLNDAIKPILESAIALTQQIAPQVKAAAIAFAENLQPAFDKAIKFGETLSLAVKNGNLGETIADSIYSGLKAGTDRFFTAENFKKLDDLITSSLFGSKEIDLNSAITDRISDVIAGAGRLDNLADKVRGSAYNTGGRIDMDALSAEADASYKAGQRMKTARLQGGVLIGDQELGPPKPLPGPSTFRSGAISVNSLKGQELAKTFDGGAGRTIGRPEAPNRGGGLLGMLARMAKPLIPQVVARMSGQLLTQSGFAGLGGLASMQADKAAGVQVGTNTLLSSGSRRLGQTASRVRTGVQGAVGGLGAHHALSRERFDARKRAREEAKNQIHGVEKTNSLLSNIERDLRTNLTVSAN